MVQNMQLAASEMDSVLVELLSTWAERGRDGSPRSQVCTDISVCASSLVYHRCLTCVLHVCIVYARYFYVMHPGHVAGQG